MSRLVFETNVNGCITTLGTNKASPGLTLTYFVSYLMAWGSLQKLVCLDVARSSIGIQTEMNIVHTNRICIFYILNTYCCYFYLIALLLFSNFI